MELCLGLLLLEKCKKKRLNFDGFACQVTWHAPREETLNGELKEFEIRWRKGREDPAGEGCVEAASSGSRPSE